MSLAPFVFAVVAGAFAAPPPKKARIEAGVEGTAAEAEAYLTANASIVQKSLPEAVRKCARGAEPSTMVGFDLAVQVGKSGKPVKSVATPLNPFTRCVAEAVKALTFTEPPRDALGVHFEVAFTE